MRPAEPPSLFNPNVTMLKRNLWKLTAPVAIVVWAGLNSSP
jgi:hypothetical protein